MKKKRFVLSALLLCLVAPVPVLGQDLATLRVTVADPSGAVIPAAQVSLLSNETGARRAADTADNGLAVLASLTPGRWELVVSAPSFRKDTRTVELTVGQTASLKVTLAIASIEETAIVSDSLGGLDREKAELSQVIAERQIDDLPIQGRQFIDFVLLTPSVSVGRSTESPSQSPLVETVLKISFAGVRETHTSYFALDGLDYTTSISGVQRITPSQDWVDQFRVVLNPSTVDTGRHLGGLVNIVTKSGTNEFHGSIYEFFRNDALNADNLLSRPGFDTLRSNNFGAAIGGPLSRDKAFFFAGYEGLRRAESPIYSDFILQSIDGINFVKQFFGLAPEDLSSILRTNDTDQFIVKLDHNLTDSTDLNARYLFADQRNENALGAPPGFGLPSSFRTNPIRDQTVAANLVTAASDFTSETGFQYAHRSFHLAPEGIGLEPSLQIPNLLVTGGIVGSFMFYQEERVQVSQTFTKHIGNHSLRFGGEVQKIWNDVAAPTITPGLAIFSPDSFFGAPPDTPPTAEVFIFTQPLEFFGRQIPSRDPNFQAGLFAGGAGEALREATSPSFSHEIYSAFIQDQWRIRPNLTLTLGLRYEVETMPSDLASGRFNKIDFNNIQPRVGLAWSLNGNRTVLRAGAGLYVGPTGFSGLLGTAINGGPIGTYLDNPLIPQLQNPEELLNGFSAAGAVGAEGGEAFETFVRFGIYPTPEEILQFPLGFIERDFPSREAYQASLQLEHDLGREYSVSASYQYMHALKLQEAVNANAIPIGTLPDGRNLLAPADHDFGFTFLVTPTGFSIYHAGTATLQKRFAQGYSARANYTFSKSVDNTTTLQFQTLAQDFTRPDLERAVSDNHAAHRFTLSFLAEAPQESFLRDFKLSVLANLQSARFSTIFAGFDVNGDDFPFPDRVGAIGRNTYRGDPFYSFDLRLQRAISFEASKLEFSAEFFNLFNSVNVLDVNDVYGAPFFVGPVPQEFGDGIRGPVESFGTPKNVGTARQIQFGIRFRF